MRRLALLLGLALILPVLPPDARAQPAPAACASEAARKLGFLVGTWKVHSRFRVSPNPEKWEETDGRAEISYLFDGCVLEERLQGTRQGHPFQMVTLHAFDKSSGKYQWVGADSEHGTLLVYEGALAGEELTLDASLALPGRKVTLQRVVRRQPGGGFEVRFQRSDDGGATWSTPWTLTYSKE